AASVRHLDAPKTGAIRSMGPTRAAYPHWADYAAGPPAPSLPHRCAPRASTWAFLVKVLLNTVQKVQSGSAGSEEASIDRHHFCFRLSYSPIIPNNSSLDTP